MSKPLTGISGIAVHMPPFRVDLHDWANWTGEDWNKVRDVIGTGFRLPGPQQSVYTMAANAVLRLIDNYEIDPTEVRYLALGTESSTDNSAGAVIIKGMVDDALRLRGKPGLSRNCEVPEFKHACLGGVYAIKNALRFLGTDGSNSKAIVICSDIAQYELGSSGEPTQGAGAVALLLETNPKLLSIDLSESGSASDYRGLDFRKPIQYRSDTGQTYATSNIPVFNGRYSAACYIDEMLYALDDMYAKRSLNSVAYQKSVAAIFMHRPFRRMPENGWGMACLFSLASNTNGGQELMRSLCAEASLSFDDVMEEAANPRNFSHQPSRETIDEDFFPLMNKLLRKFRGHDNYRRLVTEKMTLGCSQMQELGNMYSGALPAWVAAGLEDAANNSIELGGQEILLIGYGSGDAAEAIPARVTDNWKDAALRIDMQTAMADPINLSQEQYIALRQGDAEVSIDFEPRAEFVVDHVGSENETSFQDTGIEYYRYIS
jgi:hydroxymethylglutaryl-CoA synthase